MESNIASFVGKEVVLCYLNQSEGQRLCGQPPRAIPCRIGKIKRAERRGSFVVLVYELGNFVFPKFTSKGKVDYTEYQKYLHSERTKNIADCEIPIVWSQSPNDKYADGYWFSEVKSPDLEIVEVTKDEAWPKWECLVKELGASPDFSLRNLTVFYYILYIQRSQTNDNLGFRNNLCKLRRPGEHEVGLYIVATKEEVDRTTWIRFSSLRDYIEFQINPLLTVDSGYDIKRVRFTVPPSSRKKLGTITVDLCETYEQKVGKAPL